MPCCPVLLQSLRAAAQQLQGRAADKQDNGGDIAQGGTGGSGVRTEATSKGGSVFPSCAHWPRIFSMSINKKIDEDFFSKLFGVEFLFSVVC